MRVIRLNICVPILVSGTSCKHIHKERVTIPTPRAMSLFASGLTSDGHAIVGLADAWKKGDTNMISHILRESHGFDGKVVKHETGRVELQLTPASGEDESVGQQYCVDVLGKFFAKEKQSVPAASAPVSTGAALGSNAVVRIFGSRDRVDCPRSQCYWKDESGDREGVALGYNWRGDGKVCKEVPPVEQWKEDCDPLNGNSRRHSGEGDRAQINTQRYG